MVKNNVIKIGIADDHLLVRDGFVSILNSCKDFEVVFEVSNGKELLKALKETRPDIVLLDIAMPVVDGITAIKEMRRKHSRIKIVIISAHSEPGSIIEYVSMGAVAFLPKICTKSTLITAIYEVHENGSYFDPATIKLLTRRGVIKERKLTDGEQLVLKYLCIGKTYEEIATILKINVRTAKWYKHILLVKTDCEDVPQLVKYARDNNLV